MESQEKCQGRREKSSHTRVPCYPGQKMGSRGAREGHRQETDPLGKGRGKFIETKLAFAPQREIRHFDDYSRYVNILCMHELPANGAR
jgi:hypothetical protein